MVFVVLFKVIVKMFVVLGFSVFVCLVFFVFSVQWMCLIILVEFMFVGLFMIS